MLFWWLFGLFAVLFGWSLWQDRRAFANAIYLMLAGSMLFLALASSTENQIVLHLLQLVFFGAIIICFGLIPITFVITGIISIRKNGFSLAHSLSILFGIGLWLGLWLIGSIAVSSRSSILFLSLAILVQIAIIYVLFTFIALFLYAQLYLLIPKNLKCDFIIIHGAGLIDGKTVSPLLARRLEKGIKVYRRSGQRAKIIVSGGRGSDEQISEAEAMRQFLLDEGIDADAIILEDQSTTTFENLQFSKQITDRQPGAKVIFVTNNYHVFRTSIYARKLQFKAEGVGCRTALHYWPNAFVREYIAIIIQYKIVPLLLLILWMLGTLISLSPFNFN